MLVVLVLEVPVDVEKVAVELDDETLELVKEDVVAVLLTVVPV